MKNKGTKRAKLPTPHDHSKKFRKDWKKLHRAGRFDLGRARQAMELIVKNEGPLGPEWRDHALIGNLNGYRECHIGGDLIMIYRIEENEGNGRLVVFTRIGTHNDLF